MSDLMPLPSNSSGLIVTDEQAKAVQGLSYFGATAVSEIGALAQYVGRVLGTMPEDVVGLVIGDPLRFVRTAIAAKYDVWLTQIFRDRNVTPQSVSPSLAIPLLRAAYDESRPELQELWAKLIAAAMDAARANRVRRSFIDALQKFDPLDALVLKTRHDLPGNLSPNARDHLASRLQVSSREIEVSVINLVDLRCLRFITPAVNTAGDYAHFIVSPYGYELVRACSDQ